MKKFLIIIFAVFFLAELGIFLPKNNENKEEIVLGQALAENKEESKGPEIIFAPEEEEIKPEVKGLEAKNEIPDKVYLEVPFLSQAPFQKWDALHEDSCEEASLIMVKYFLDGKESISKEQGEKEIQDMIKYETKNKYGLSITLSELDGIAEEYYNLENGRIGKNITVDDIKQELAEGRPVIVGAAGKVLPNPNFKNGGPNYHMLVVIGYDEKGFITNDPGTRLGKDFRYTFNDLLKSIHDWNEKNILNGEKNYLVFD